MRHYWGPPERAIKVLPVWERILLQQCHDHLTLAPTHLYLLQRDFLSRSYLFLPPSPKPSRLSRRPQNTERSEPDVSSLTPQTCVNASRIVVLICRGYNELSTWSGPLTVREQWRGPFPRWPLATHWTPWPGFDSRHWGRTLATWGLLTSARDDDSFRMLADSFRRLN